MTRKATTAEDETPLPPHGKAPPPAAASDAELLPCIACGEPATRATLSLLGARCQGCYRAYQREALRPIQPRRDSPAMAAIRKGRRHMAAAESEAS
jgi:hypothetical protein